MVSFPKQVHLLNKRLNYLYWVILFLISFLLAVKWMYLKEYSRQDLITGEASLITKSSWRELEQAWPEILQRRVCTDPWKYALELSGANVVLPYLDVSCGTPCAVGAASNDCVSSYEASWDEPNSVFFVTAWDQHILTPEGSEDKNRVTLLPFDEFQSVLLEYAAVVDQFSIVRSNQHGMGELQDTYDTNANITTVVLDSQSTERQRFHAGEKISFTLSEMFDLAGTSLDSFNGRGKAEDPTFRLSGIELLVDVVCTDYALHDSELAEGGLTCYLSVGAKLQAWSYLQEMQVVNGNGAIRARNYRGVRVSAQVSGAFTRPDISTMLNNVAATMVFLSVPKMLIYFVAVTLLGEMSVVIRRVMKQRFCMATEAAAVGMRMITTHAAFSSLQDTPEGLSKAGLRGSVESVLSDRSVEVGDSELTGIVNFLYRHTHKSHPQGGKFNVLQHMLDLETTKSVEVEEERPIHPDQWQHLNTFTDPMTFDCFVKVFDTDRKVSVLEGLFMDPDIMAARERVPMQCPYIRTHSQHELQCPEPEAEDGGGVELLEKERVAVASIGVAVAESGGQADGICASRVGKGQVPDDMDQYTFAAIQARNGGAEGGLRDGDGEAGLEAGALIGDTAIASWTNLDSVQCPQESFAPQVVEAATPSPQLGTLRTDISKLAIRVEELWCRLNHDVEHLRNSADHWAVSAGLLAVAVADCPVQERAWVSTELRTHQTVLPPSQHVTWMSELLKRTEGKAGLDGAGARALVDLKCGTQSTGREMLQPVGKHDVDTASSVPGSRAEASTVSARATGIGLPSPPMLRSLSPRQQFNSGIFGSRSQHQQQSQQQRPSLLVAPAPHPPLHPPTHSPILPPTSSTPSTFAFHSALEPEQVSANWRAKLSSV